MPDMRGQTTSVFWRAEYVKEGWIHEQLDDDDGEEDDQLDGLDEDGGYENTADRLMRLLFACEHDGLS